MEDNKISVEFYLHREAIEEQVVCALVKSIAGAKVEQGYYEEDGEWVPRKVSRPALSFEETLRNRVSKMLDEKLAEVLTIELEDQLRQIVKTRIEEIAEQGMPEFNRYGEMSYTPWSKAISRALESITKKNGSSSYDQPKVVSIAQEAFKEHVITVLKEESENIKAAVRAAVDEQLSGTVIKTLREAIGLR